MKDSIKKREVQKDLDPQEFDRQFIRHYHDAIDKAITIHQLKRETYNGQHISYKDYTRVKNHYPSLLWGKVLRMVSIVEGSNNNFESLEDTMVDMINYAAFCYATFKMKVDKDK